MDDAQLVLAVRNGDQNAFADIYDRYADRLFTYATALLRDRSEAADVVSETFLSAMSRIEQLREPSALRPWLYAICRHEAFRRSRQRSKYELTDVVPEQIEQASDEAFDDEAFRSLVWDAAEGLNERDRMALELHYRHGLDGDEFAQAMGTSTANGYVILSRLRDQLEKTMGALLIARKGRDDCEQLAEVLKGWDGKFSPVVRKRVVRHIDSCEICKRRRAAALTPESLAGASPFIAAPAELRAAVLEAAKSVTPERPANWKPDNDGFPTDGKSNGKLIALLVAMTAILVLLFAGMVALLDDDESTVDTVDVESTTSITIAETSTTVATESTTTTQPDVTTTTTQRQRTTTTLAPVVPPTVGTPSASPGTIAELNSGGASCTAPPDDPQTSVSATVSSSAPITSVTLRYTIAGTQYQVAMSQFTSGGPYAVGLGPFPHSTVASNTTVSMSVIATNQAGGTATSSIGSFVLMNCT